MSVNGFRVKGTVQKYNYNSLDNIPEVVKKPSTNPDGTQGQLLQTDGHGGTSWTDVGTPSDAQVESAVTDWLDEHPEATTTVQDGSITKAKLATALAEDVDEIAKLREDLDNVTDPVNYAYYNDWVSDGADVSFSGNNIILTVTDATKAAGAYIDVPGNGGGVTISFDSKTPSSASIRIGAFNSDKNVWWDTYISESPFTALYSFSKIRIELYVNQSAVAVGTTATFTKLQIERATSDSPTEFSKTPLTAKDYVLREKVDELESNVDDEISNLKEDLSEIKDALEAHSTEIDVTNLVNLNSFWNSETSVAVFTDYTGTYVAYSAIDVAAGDKYNIVIFQQSSLKQHPVLLVDNSLNIIKAYRDDDISQGGKHDGYATFDIDVPTGATKMLLTGRNDKTVTLTKNVTRIDQIEKSVKSYSGKKLSLLGDSISALAGEIPTGNAPYYNGSTYGISSRDQMWWGVLCSDLGMEPLVINAWSGSCVTLGIRDDTTPASDASRCEALHNEDVMPDVIMIAMGVNDYTYMTSESQYGYWDGTTTLGEASDLSDYITTDFARAYATMIARIKKKYPDAEIICITPWFCQRKNVDTGATYVNQIGKTESDYGDTIRSIANLMGVRVIDGTNLGFNRYNYYPTYCEDSAKTPTHPNATGQIYMGHAIANEVLNDFSTNTKVFPVDSFKEMSATVDSVENNLIASKYDDIVIGTISSAMGQDATGTSRCRTNGYIPIKDFWYCDTRDVNYGYMIYLYNEDKEYVDRYNSSFRFDELIEKETLKSYPTAVYLRILFRNNPDATMSDADCKKVANLIRVYNSNNSTILNDDALAQLNSYTNIAKICSNYFSTNFLDLEIGTIQGSNGQDSASATRCRTKGYVPFAQLICCNVANTVYKLIVFCYDSQYAFIKRFNGDFDAIDLTRFDIIRNVPETMYVRFTFSRTDGASMTESDIIALRSVIYINANVLKINEDKARFDKQFNYVAYSQLATNDAPANTEEHFINCANAGTFTALKGDVRNTADGGLIMCHDAGYTFDSSDKIIKYDKTNNTPIDTLTVVECKALTFADQWESKDCHPCDFETFVRVCKKYGLIAYVTVRDEHIADVVAPEVLRILELYRMLDRAIVNSFTHSTLEIFRTLNSSITLSLVLNHNYIPTTDDVDYAVSLGNCNLNLFNVPVDSSVPGTNVEDKLEYLLSGEEYAEILDYAHSKNIVLYDAQTGNAAPDVLLRHGIVGAHMTVIPDYNWKRS